MAALTGRSVVLGWMCIWAAWGQTVPLSEHPAIAYATAPLTDSVSNLDRGIREGRMHLDFDFEHGYLLSLLKALHVPVESQILVFSKTSLQGLLTEPRNPRMIFFNDSVIVGLVQGGFPELASHDPRQGLIFYRASRDPVAVGESPLSRREDCLRCHSVPATLDVPGGLMQSVYPAPDGTPLATLGELNTDDRTPIEKRWGGWYVTGTSVSARHMGNAVVTDARQPEPVVNSLELESLTKELDKSALLSPYSDIAALMVFGHQMHMMNLLTLVGWETRIALSERAAGPALARRLRPVVNEFVDYLLFVEETPLPQPVQGTSGFKAWFEAQGPRDHRGRSLRQLDLADRLTRYPCSYMIYSEAFDALPLEAKRAIYARMWRILSGEERLPRYKRLSLARRKEVVDILRDTKSDLPTYYRTALR